MWRRLAAILYDALLLIAVWFLATIPFIALNAGEAVAPSNIEFRVYLVAVTAAYFIGFWRWGGQTAGMRAWRLRVEAIDGSRLTWRQGALRAVVSVVAAACGGLGFVWALFTREHATWHDLASRTKLVVLAPTQRREARRSTHSPQ